MFRIGKVRRKKEKEKGTERIGTEKSTGQRATVLSGQKNKDERRERATKPA